MDITTVDVQSDKIICAHEGAAIELTPEQFARVMVERSRRDQLIVGRDEILSVVSDDGLNRDR